MNYNDYRRQSREIRVGSLTIGGNSPISVQSMTNTVTSNISETVLQIKNLEKAGCDIVRVAVADEQDAVAICEIKKQINIMLMNLIQFLEVYHFIYGNQQVKNIWIY